MKQHVEFVDPGDTILSAAQTMRERNVGILPVCASDGRVLGVVTDRDLVLRICAEDLPAKRTPVCYAMSSGLIACRPYDSLEHVEALMRKHRVTRIVVTDDAERVCGIISLSDLAFYEPAGRMGKTLRDIAERKYEPRGGP